MTLKEKLKAFIQDRRAKKIHKAREEQVLKECGCICYCPGCKNILNDQAECSQEKTYESGPEYIKFRCSCDCLSLWSFDHPVPILITRSRPVPDKVCAVCNKNKAIGKTRDATNICADCAIQHSRGFVTFEMLDKRIESHKKEKET